MLKRLREDYKILKNSEEFKNYGFLCGAFLICNIEEIDKTPWQIDFYNKKNDTITTYLIDKKIEVTDDSKILKDEKTEIEELNLNDVKIDFEDIKEKLDNILKKYNETAVKITIILQTQKFPIWNVIFITKKINIINVKINAINGSVVEDNMVPLITVEK
ncbi:hypothetical protein HYU23_03930 [Candidatus Woesearchaeota archaeon]|nr:hypothetical protein [Candidatus Woesearchaeota archaeon]